MSRGPGRCQRAALELLDEQRGEMLFGEIAVALDAQQHAARIALRRALCGLVSQGRLGKRARKYMYGGPRDIVWFKPQ